MLLFHSMQAAVVLPTVNNILQYHPSLQSPPSLTAMCNRTNTNSSKRRKGNSAIAMPIDQQQGSERKTRLSWEELHHPSSSSLVSVGEEQMHKDECLVDKHSDMRHFCERHETCL